MTEVANDNINIHLVKLMIINIYINAYWYYFVYLYYTLKLLIALIHYYVYHLCALERLILGHLYNDYTEDS